MSARAPLTVPRGPLLALRGASFGHAGRAVVSGVDLEVGPGRFLGIVGANGCGKTTLLRGLLGLLPPLAGAREVAPGAVLGYVPQRESLDAAFPLSTLETVEMGAYARLDALRRPGKGEREAALALLERVGLAEERGTPFAALSGGQRQRALLARALLARPHVLLLDEPTSGVDRAAEERILALLSGLAAGGLAILLVSHHLSRVREAAGEVLLVADGSARIVDRSELLAAERLDASSDVGSGAGG